ncbi:sensor histidine kinase [Cryobacterium sp. TMT1-2-2]|uniref:sensor histidine kinase n=1 Tax=Cryobacterium sp. TMT1-2-2 TaxID=1259233 RepID=UPI00106C8D10|nr:sensor histidine kinase [Cryobacterium sp. TMT1-2-2]TFD13344.1 sensor histidine kinase [Cryobacterium sp. TMT1-2-2]
MTTARWWDVAFGGALAVMAITVTLYPADGSLGGALATLAALGLAYLGFGRRGIRLAGTGRTASSLAFLATVVLGCGVGAAFTPNLSTLQAIGFPVVWVLAGSYLRAVLVSGILAVSVGLGLTVSLGGTVAAMAEAGGIEAISFIFALALGTWMTRIICASDRHRRLLDELTRTQGELNALHRAAGSSAERERLAREIHDTIAQTLTGLVMLAQRTRGELTTTPARVMAAQTSIDLIETNAREALTETRALVATLSPVREPGLGLAGTILRLADRFTQETGIQTDATVQVGDIDREVEVVLLRCVQEGLANVRQHSGAEAASVFIEGAGAAVVLTVSDDGRGLGVPRVDPNTGFGLAGMRDRVLLVHGELELGTRPTGGTLLRVTVPLPAPLALAAPAAPLSRIKADA